jgi:PAS domain S-box-containing protein
MGQILQRSVLIVEDEQLVALDLQQTLKRMGYDAFALAASGDEAISRSKERRPDIVLMDIHLRGDRDGVETAEQFRAELDVPVVYLTAHSDELTLERAKKTEPLGYLIKPVKAAELRTVIELALHRHDAEQNVRRQERWLAMVLQSISDAVVAVCASGLVRLFNPAAERLFGVSSHQALGRPAADVVRFERGSGDPDVFAAALQQRLVHALEEATLAGAHGGGRLVSYGVAPVVERDQLLGAVLVARDLTARRQLQQQLEVAERLASLGILSAGLAHEINNPLSVLLAQNYAVREDLDELLQDLGASGLRRERVLDSMTDMQAAIQRIRKIVADLGEFSRPHVEQSVSGDVTRAVDWAVRVSANELRHRGSIAVDIAAGLPPVVLDETRLGQVLINLVMNAAKALPFDRAQINQVRVSAAQQDEFVCIEVADNGTGMSPEVQARIFDPFYTTRPGAGTGLGLAICHGIVTSARGAIEVESETGRGSTFRVRLPVATAPATSQPPHSAPQPSAAGRILLVDDDQLVLRAMSRALEFAHEVVCADSAEAALGLIRRGERFDVILCDVLMPSMSGPAFYWELNRTYPDAAKSVIFLSGSVGRAEEILRDVPVRVLQKPISVEELNRVISSAIAASRVEA